MTDDAVNARYFRAFLITLVALVIYSIYILLEAAQTAIIMNDGLTFIFPAVILAIVCFLIIIMHNRSEKEAFYIPLTLFLTITFKCIITGDYSDYYFLCILISCLGALFFNKRELLKYILFSNVIIAIQIIIQIPLVRSVKLIDMEMIISEIAKLANLDMSEIPEAIKNEMFNLRNIKMTTSEKLYNWFMVMVVSFSAYLGIDFADNKNDDAKKAHDFFVGTLLATPDPMVLLDSQNRITYISMSFMKILRVERSSYARGRSIFDLLKDQNLKDLFYDLLTKSDSSQTTHEIILDGQQNFFEIVVSKLAESKGYFVNIVNITPVMKAKFEAEAASRSKSAFLATMSHEIRTPLNAIIGLSGIQLQKDLSTSTRDDLEKIHNSGGSLLAIINDILDISKIETGSFELVQVDYDIPSLVNDTVQLNIVRIGQKKITFKLEIDKTIPVRLFGDELRIKQILNNLLSNAFKYTKEGTVTLAVSWEKQGDNAWVIFSIHDTGQGIRQKDIPKLFSEYSQLDARANRYIEGTGLGLSITKNLVSLMNGKISVESEHGKGSTFMVQIPQRIMDETPIGEQVVQNLESFRFKEIHHNQSLRLTRSYMPYGKVLVVDDVETNLAVARGLMQPYGLSIDTALSGPDAIEKIKNAGDKDEPSRYDVIFMDHMMPGMDGLETVRIIRNELSGSYGKTVPIIALTANALVGNERMFLARGFNAFISKPVDVIQLDTILNTWVRDKQSEEILKEAETEQAKISNDSQDTSDVLAGVTVKGIDLAQGRERYDSAAAYLEILRSWCLHTPHLLEKLRNLSEETLSEYSITVHGLKGSSYGILANEVGKQAAELESLAKAGDLSSVQVINPAFIEMVESLLQELGALLKKVSAGNAAKQKIPSPDPVLLAKLLDAAKRYKSTLMEEIMDSIELYDYESGGELVVWLREQMDNLEYDLICSKLEDISSQTGNQYIEG